MRVQENFGYSSHCFLYTAVFVKNLGLDFNLNLRGKSKRRAKKPIFTSVPREYMRILIQDVVLHLIQEKSRKDYN